MKSHVARTLLIAVALLQMPLAAQQTFVRDPKIAVDEEYTKKIKEYTTQPFFTSPLVDYLPASKTVPTPKAVLGDVAGAPGILPYAEEVYQYMRMLEKASPRVKVYSIGRTEEGREMIAVAVTSEAEHGEADAEQRPPREARRSAHHQHGRRAGREADRPDHSRSTTSPARSTRRRRARRPR